MMFAFLFAYVSPLLAISGKLSSVENAKLQEDCGIIIPGPIRRSVHTLDVRRSESPWTVFFLKTSNWYPNITLKARLDGPSDFCSGSLISNRHIITAAHCIGKVDCEEDGRKTMRKVNIGRFVVFFSNGITRYVSKVFISPEFHHCSPKRAPNGDVAILELEEEVTLKKDLSPACLHDEQVSEGTTLSVYGYGINGTTDSHSLRKYTGVVKGNCSESSSDSLCLYHKMAAFCPGDNGASNVLFDKRGVASIAAIASFVVDCDRLNSDRMKEPVSTIVYSTSIYQHIHWICAATGICTSEKVEETVKNFEEHGLIQKWFTKILPLKGHELYV